MRFLLLLLLLFGAGLERPYAQSLGQWVSCAPGCKLWDPDPMPGVDYQWQGECRDGKAHGSGIARKMVEGRMVQVLEGGFVQGIAQGPGKLRTAEGDIYEGPFEDGQLQGSGRALLKGRRYVGQFASGRMFGRGRMVFDDGSSLEGIFADGVLYVGQIWYLGNVVEEVRASEVADKPYTPPLGKDVKEFLNDGQQLCPQAQATGYRMVRYRAPGRPQGAVRYYDLQGQLQQVVHYAYLHPYDPVLSVAEGPAYVYEGGKKRQSCYYHQGELHGPDTTWHEQGSRASIGLYVHGKLKGKQWWYDQQGRPERWCLEEDFGEHQSLWQRGQGMQRSWVSEGMVWLHNQLQALFELFYRLPLDTNKDFSLDVAFRTPSPDTTAQFSIGVQLAGRPERPLEVIFRQEAESGRCLWSVERVHRQQREVLSPFSSLEGIFDPGWSNTMSLQRIKGELVVLLNSEELYRMPADEVHAQPLQLTFGVQTPGLFCIESLQLEQYFVSPGGL